MMSQRPTILWFALSLGFAGFAFALAGCSDNQLNNPVADMATISDLSAGPDLSFPDRDPSDHPPLPQVTNFGGPVLANIEIWTVVWQGDEELGARVQRFNDWMLKSDYWKDALGEYGVGPGVAKGVIVWPNPKPATIDDKELKNIVKTVITMLPETINANSVISFIIPESTNSTMQGGQGCLEYGGYHSQTRTVAGGTESIPYMVNLQCQEGQKVSFDLLTEVISHEAAEAASDPFPFSTPGWTNTTVLVGGEIGDICVGLITSYEANFSEVDAGAGHETYVVQRMYSQKIAVSGKADPCVPAPLTPYFNVALEPSDAEVKVDATTGEGETIVQIQPYAFGDVGEIEWMIWGADQISGVTMEPTQGFTQAGKTLRLSIKATTLAKGNQIPLIVEAKTEDGIFNLWFGSLTIR